MQNIQQVRGEEKCGNENTWMSNNNLFIYLLFLLYDEIEMGCLGNGVATKKNLGQKLYFYV